MKVVVRGQYVLIARKMRNITQSELAKKLDKSISWVSLVEKNDVNMDLETVVLLANTLNVKADLITIMPKNDENNAYLDVNEHAIDLK